MKKLNKIALSVMAVVAVGIGFSGCDKNKASSNNVDGKIALIRSEVDNALKGVKEEVFNDTVNAKIATARSDVSSIQKQIISKVFADNMIDKLMQPKAPNGESWGEWIMEVAGLDSGRWAVGKLGVYPIDIISTQTACYDDSKTPLIWINPRTGSMHFNPSKLALDSDKSKFCKGLRDSYKDAKTNGDKVVPLVSSSDSSW